MQRACRVTRSPHRAWIEQLEPLAGPARTRIVVRIRHLVRVVVARQDARDFRHPRRAIEQRPDLEQAIVTNRAIGLRRSHERSVRAVVGATPQARCAIAREHVVDFVRDPPQGAFAHARAHDDRRDRAATRHAIDHAVHDERDERRPRCVVLEHDGGRVRPRIRVEQHATRIDRHQQHDREQSCDDAQDDDGRQAHRQAVTGASDRATVASCSAEKGPLSVYRVVPSRHHRRGEPCSPCA